MSVDAVALSKFRSDILRKYNPGFKCFHEAERALITSALTKMPDSEVVLDAGCGYTSSFKRCNHAPRRLVGVDLDLKALTQNPEVDFGCVCDLGRLPFPKESVGLIVSRDVLEHLEDPMRVLDEFARVLQPRGTLVVSATNLYSYITTPARMMPARLKALIRKLCGAGAITEDLPLYYRANRLGRLKSMLSQRGLGHVESEYYGRAFEAFLFCRPLFVLATVGDRLTNHPQLRWLKGTFLGMWYKEAPTRS